jgi:hypothetical protein
MTDPQLTGMRRLAPFIIGILTDYGLDSTTATC